MNKSFGLEWLYKIDDGDEDYDYGENYNDGKDYDEDCDGDGDVVKYPLSVTVCSIFYYWADSKESIF